ncbi:MAG: flagellin [Oscillospiraceae bacterium]|nr:flagellin [Oscillospiraceae bacterium]
MEIQHNIPGMNAKRNLRKNNSSLQKNLEKLSSGFRINRSADDAAGLAISEKMRMSIAGFEQGERNVSDGISLLQTADGALKEVQEMLTRMITLSTQAANDTLSEEDRQKIQEEIDQILQDITRIKNDTEFNGIPLFQGTDEVIVDSNGDPTISGDIPFGDFSLIDTTLHTGPFSNNSSADNLKFQAIVNNSSSAVNGSRYDLLFGSGSTSDSSLRMTYAVNGVDKTVTVDFDNLTYVGISGDISDSSDPLCRTFSYQNSDGVALNVKQKIHVTENAAEKYYNVSYEFENTGTADVDAKFMFHADTAYNNNDLCEGYFINGQKVNTTGVYTNGNGLISGAGVGQTPDSFSIVNEDQSLAFTEKIVFTGDKPDLSVGIYSEIRNWDYYNTPQTGISADNKDLGFGLVWGLDTISSTPGSADQSKSVSFQYGIADVEQDNNLTGVTINRDPNPVTQHSKEKQIWIQASAESESSGMWIAVDEMNCQALGIEGMDVTTRQGAVRAIQQAKAAKNIVSENTGKIGAYQNRLEHTYQNLGVMKENLVKSESQIRDVDIAAEMMAYTKNSILSQSAQAMLAQCNQQKQGVLQLMQPN